MLLVHYFYLLLIVLLQPTWQVTHCKYNKNLTKNADDIESCLFYFLLQKEYAETGDINSLAKTPPNVDDLKITIENVLIRYVELVKGSSYQFNVYGDMYLNWVDERMKWEKDGEFGDHEHLYIFNSSAIWTPHVIDHSLCMDSGCQYEIDDLDVYDNGRIYGRVQFKYTASCMIDFRKFPEEEDSCCIFFTAFEQGIARTSFEIEGKSKEKLTRPVYAQKVYDKEERLEEMIQEHSPWMVLERTLSVTHLGGIDSLQVLQVCIKAEKQMSTVRMALILPVTLATYVMLASPLFGDLRMQLFVKLFSLHIQTICFIYLCSITPTNGFLGVRPRIYIFYELIFLIAFFSIIMTVFVMALSRLKRTVPPSHRIYLMAKLVNRMICCVEPERCDSYHRYVEDSLENPSPDNSQQPQQQQHRNDNGIDYTQDWRHIYLAINNMFSALMLSIFILATFLEFF